MENCDIFSRKEKLMITNIEVITMLEAQDINDGIKITVFLTDPVQPGLSYKKLCDSLIH